jgi:YihY family inner membrane protein
METVAGGESSTLGTALIVSLLIALWSASGGMAGLIEGINAAYDEVDRRKFPIKRGLALLLTVGAIVALLVTIGLIAVLPAVLGNLGLGQAGELAIRIGTWPLLALLAMAGLALLYKVAPDRDRPAVAVGRAGARSSPPSCGSSAPPAFTLYVENFGNFGETYGTFAGIIVLMLWLFLSSFIVLLGAEINAEIERQTSHDTTVGEPAPLRRAARTRRTRPPTTTWRTATAATPEVADSGRRPEVTAASVARCERGHGTVSDPPRWGAPNPYRDPADPTVLLPDEIAATLPDRAPGARRRPEYRTDVHELSERLRELQRPIRILSALQWPAEVQERFFAAGAQRQPEVSPDTYAPCPTTSASCSGPTTT